MTTKVNMGQVYKIYCFKLQLQYCSEVFDQNVKMKLLFALLLLPSYVLSF